MVQGTMSGAGKSLLAAALCRIFSQDGYRTAPFKSQNMALNSHITLDGLEMGRAQAVQAQAAGKEPDVRMNPILLKPSSDVGSQLIVNGEVRGNYAARDYFRMKKSLIPDILSAYNSLCEENDIIVIEGAGSPAEINLRADDIVNMGLAELVNAPVLLVGDIDRGGVFAQLYGTVALLESQERSRIIGTIINKFRGDVDILKPGLTMLEDKTGIPVLGVVPYTHAQIDDEDSLAPALNQTTIHKAIDIAVIRLPRISNFTDLSPLEYHPALGVRYVQNPHDLGIPDMVILPGTKSTMDDLIWLRQCGLEAAILKLAAKGMPVMGICGGFQMLGTRLSDPDGIEHTGSADRTASMHGMGLLPCETVFTAAKTRTRVTGRSCMPRSCEAVSENNCLLHLGGAAIEGYEIHMGKTTGTASPFCLLEDGRPEGAIHDNVLGTYLHGVFDSGELTEKLAAWLLDRKGLTSEEVKIESHREYQERQFDILASEVRSALDMDAIYKAMAAFEKKSEEH